MSELRIMDNSSKFVGTVSEIALTEQKGSIKGENGKDISCNIILGNVVIENKNGTFPLRVYCASKTKQGEKNKMYEGYQTIMKSYITKLMVSKDPSLGTADFVSCRTRTRLNDFVGRNGELVHSIRIDLNGMRRITDGEETSAVDMEGVIIKILPEKKGEKETGRLEIEFLNVAYGGVAHPYTAFVPEDLADDFMDIYKVGDTCALCFELKSTTQKKQEVKKAAFGKIINTNDEYERLELVVVGGEAPYEEDDEYEDGTPKCLPKSDVKELMNERKIYLEDLKKKDREKDKSSKSESKRGLGSVRKASEDEDDDDGENIDYSELFD